MRLAPFPVPDDQADTYGKGYLTGTIIGIASTQQEAERRLGAGEVPDHRHRRGRGLRQRDPQRAVDAWRPSSRPSSTSDPSFQTFLEIAQNPTATPPRQPDNGGAYQLTLQDLGYDYESGKETDLQAGPREDAKQIDTDIAQAQN